MHSLGTTDSAIAVMLFLREGDISIITWLVEFWNSRKYKIFSIVPWNETTDSIWALHINLSNAGKLGQEILIPIPSENKPSLSEAIDIFRNMKISYA